jgi:hypothetical protein
MATAETFELDKSGAFVTEIDPPLPLDEKFKELTGIDKILVMMADPDVTVADISREIAQAMGAIMQLMTSSDPLGRGSLTQRELNEQIKAYRELQRTLVESEVLSKKDVLNLEGPKFSFVLKQLIGIFQKSLKDSGCDEGLQKNVMLQFGDLLRTNYDSLKRELNRI